MWLSMPLWRQSVLPCLIVWFGLLGSRCRDRVESIKGLTGSNTCGGKGEVGLRKEVSDRVSASPEQTLPNGRVPCVSQASGKLKHLRALAVRNGQQVPSWRGISVTRLSLSASSPFSALWWWAWGGLIVIQQTFLKHLLCTRHWQDTSATKVTGIFSVSSSAQIRLCPCKGTHHPAGEKLALLVGCFLSSWTFTHP